MIQIPETLLHELNILVDEQHTRIVDLQFKLDSALDTAQRLQQANIILESRNTLLCSSLLYYFTRDQKRRQERASVTVLRGDYGSHQHLGCECNCRYG